MSKHRNSKVVDDIDLVTNSRHIGKLQTIIGQADTLLHRARDIVLYQDCWAQSIQQEALSMLVYAGNLYKAYFCIAHPTKDINRMKAEKGFDMVIEYIGKVHENIERCKVVKNHPDVAKMFYLEQEDVQIRKRISNTRVNDTCLLRTFADIIGDEAFKETLIKSAIGPIKYKLLRKDAPLQNILFFGPPGTGMYMIMI
jgi:hypothetical protein